MDDLEKHVHLVGECIDDLAPLLKLPAFKALDDEIQAVVTLHHW